MAVQKGSALLVKVGNGGSPESFTTVAGLRDTSISINAETIDVTNKDSSRVRTLLANAGIKSFSEIEEGQKDIGWFCIQELIKKTTKNGKIFYRAKVCDYNMNSAWVRIWTQFKQEPSTYTMWLAELSNSGSWGLSTSSYKMRKIEV